MNGNDQVVRAIDHEKKRIAQELHDGVGQELSGIAYLTEVLRQRLAGAGRPEAEQAAQIQEMIRQTIGNARGLIEGLVAFDEDGGVANALAGFAQRIRGVFGIECVFETEGMPERLEGRSAAQLYRIVQEAVHNAIKHGHAKKIHIVMRRRGEGVELTVQDDGMGRAAGRPWQPGMGTTGMRWRARDIGGRVDLGPRGEGDGWQVTCFVPKIHIE